MKRKISLVIVVVLFISLAWYLFLKPNDYLVTFQAPTFPGAINQTVKIWNEAMRTKAPLQQNGVRHLRQELKFNDSVVEYNWEIIPLSDSTSKVKVRIKDLEHSLMNKIMIPFTNSVMEQRAKKNLLNFNDLLQKHIQTFKVKVVGEETLEPSFCAYVTVKCAQSDKAFKMMTDFPFLSSFVEEHGLVAERRVPFVEIVDWNIEQDSIKYNFCYPIVESDSLPLNKEIKYKHFPGFKALKAIYNGNYITSDRSWYRLLDFAENNALDLENTPVEVFYSNPNNGGNELDWKAEIFMPIKEKNE